MSSDRLHAKEGPSGHKGLQAVCPHTSLTWSSRLWESSAVTYALQEMPCQHPLTRATAYHWASDSISKPSEGYQSCEEGVRQAQQNKLQRSQRSFASSARRLERRMFLCLGIILRRYSLASTSITSTWLFVFLKIRLPVSTPWNCGKGTVENAL